MNSVKDLLNFDAFLEAEKITGKSYKEDEDTSRLGMLMHMMHGEKKRNQLKNLNDTYSGISWKDLLIIINDLNFIEIYSNSVETTKHGSPEIEKHFIREDGILLITHTFMSKSPNEVKIYFQTKIPRDNYLDNICLKIGGNSSPFQADDEENYYSARSKDVREGLRHIANILISSNILLNKWIKTDAFLWLNAYWDEPDDYKNVAQSKIEQYPKWAREIIGR